MKDPLYSSSHPPSKKEKIILRVLIGIGVACLFRFLYFFFTPEYRGYWPLFLLLALVILYGTLKQLYLWYHYFNISVPKTPIITKEKTVDVLTTYFPGEPYDMILETLNAIQKISYPHTTYLCDEANDPFLIEQCKALGVIHVTRDNRVNAKAGNINNALKIAKGEICLILDPDHVPKPNFLDVVLPYFEEETIGYVQVVQTYYNKPHTLVARGAAEQTFQFYGPLMMTMNSYGTVNAIGANCTFRRAALDSIGGHAPGLAEDMHTAMLLHAKGWKSVYVPKVVAKGLAPADLTSYFKQQLKWSRGTFELLYKVYPKKFSKFTTRQKIHYGLLPLHYLIGFVYLINFLIPILALTLSKMPWKGDLLHFAGVGIPLFASSLLIGAYVQKWVIEKGDRGFHVIGGLLQIATWWVFLVGVVYTFIRKKVPYLPTPKSEGDGTNFLLLLPNLCIALLSVFAIIYGLYQNFTPYSLTMAFFAFLNVLFMLFSFYLGWKTTNKNQILRQRLTNDTINNLKRIKHKFIKLTDVIFYFTRFSAPILIVACLYFSFDYQNKIEKNSWGDKNNLLKPIKTNSYIGIYEPTPIGGLSNLKKLKELERTNDINFNMVSMYESWGEKAYQKFPENHLQEVIKKEKIPLITWEPWSTNFAIPDSLQELKNGNKMLAFISAGYFDEYIRNTARRWSKYHTPIFLRFAHEFDNPNYPWSPAGKNTPSEFIKAWRHVHQLFQEEGASNVVWVWSPWKPEQMRAYYPGDDYVDWVGLDILNYGTLNADGICHPFYSLYKPFHDRLKQFTKKPVILAELGSLGLGGDKENWLKTAVSAIDQHFPEIKGLVFFNSKYDKNIPTHVAYESDYLDWSSRSLDNIKISSLYANAIKPEFRIKTKDNPIKNNVSYEPVTLTQNYRGINYYKTKNWKHNYYVANKDQLLTDFEKMKRCGINLIKANFTELYSHNLNKYAKEHNIKIIYNFDMPNTTEFLRDTIVGKALRNSILSSIRKHKNAEPIVAWHIQSTLPHYRGLNLDKASYFTYRSAFIKWLRTLTDAIKAVDKKNLVYLSLDSNPEAIDDLLYLQKENLKIDGYALVAREQDNIEPIVTTLRNYKRNFIFGDIAVESALKEKQALKNKTVILTNWQNQRELNYATMDGLLDFQGNLTKRYIKAKRFLKNTKSTFDIPEIRIMKPASPLLSSNKETYYAYYFSNGKWIQVPKSQAEKYKWMLVRMDRFDNIIATKELGKGNSVAVTIPKDYKDFKIILTIEDNGFSISTSTTLNTPLFQQ